MADICPKCGLPKEICVCDVLDKEAESKIKVSVKKAKFNKMMTVVIGIDPSEIERTTKDLKRILACGGTFKEGLIELQGNHKDNARRALITIGYKEQNIDVS